MQVPFEILECVAFICYIDKHDQYRYAGTCFYFGFEDDETHTLFSYLVTAKHVIIEAKKASFDGDIYIRVNKKDYSEPEYIKVPNDWKSLESSDEPTIDVAVLRYTSYSDYDLRLLKHDFEMTLDTINKEYISVGDEVFYTGLFTGHPGEHRNIPIVRIGNIAAFPIEGVRTKDFGKINAFLIESRSIGGLSGCPVFVHINSGQRRQFGSNLIYNSDDKIYLLGLIHGHWEIEEPKKNMLVEKGASALEKEKLNVGISIVVPVWDIIKTIELHAELKKEREITKKQ